MPISRYRYLHTLLRSVYIYRLLDGCYLPPSALFLDASCLSASGIMSLRHWLSQICSHTMPGKAESNRRYANWSSWLNYKALLRELDKAFLKICSIFHTHTAFATSSSIKLVVTEIRKLQRLVICAVYALLRKICSAAAPCTLAFWWCWSLLRAASSLCTTMGSKSLRKPSLCNQTSMPTSISWHRRHYISQSWSEITSCCVLWEGWINAHLFQLTWTVQFRQVTLLDSLSAFDQIY